MLRLAHVVHLPNRTRERTRSVARLATFPAALETLLVLAFAALGTLSASAQISTNQGLIVRDDSLGLGRGQVVPPGPDPSGNIVHYLITEDLGQLAGDDTLLHSFLDFSVGDREIATFTGGSHINHIVGRITGTGVSTVDGTIRSTIQGADLYMVNPNGFVFGEFSAIDVPGSLHVSTADYIRWESKGFEARPGGMVPTVAFADPVAFGFLNPAPAEISFENEFPLTVGEGQTLSAVAGDITFQQGVLEAPIGNIQIVSVASEGEVVMDAFDDVQTSFADLGTITLGDFSALDTSGDGGGSILIRADSLILSTGRTSILANTTGETDGGGIDIAVENLVMNGGSIQSNTSSLGNAGPIRIQVVEDLTVRNSGVIQSSTLSGALGGDAGSIDVDARTISLETGSRILSNTYSSGAGGVIDVYADASIDISGLGAGFGVFRTKSGIKAFMGGEGTGATIKITSSDLRLSDSGEIVVENHGPGAPGALEIEVDRLSIASGAFISAQKLRSGAGADITVTANESIIIEGFDAVDPVSGDPFLTGISTVAFKDATDKTGGTIRLTTPVLDIHDFVEVTSRTLGSAPAGSIIAQVDRLILERGSRLTAGTSGAGTRGTIDVSASESISLSGFHTLFPCTEAACYSGIFSFADVLATDSPGATDSAGQENIAEVSLTTPLLELTDGGWISAGTYGAAAAGEVKVNVDNLVMRGNSTTGEGARIESFSRSTGASGSVEIVATNLISIHDSLIQSDSNAAGDGGDVDVSAGLLIDASGATISSLTEEGRGGNVRLEAGRLIVLRDATQVLAIAPGSSGVGGKIEITTPTLFVTADTVIDATGGASEGEVIINSPQQIIVDQVTPLPAEFLDASSMMLASCDARRSGERAGSFTVARWRGLPVSPEGPLLAFEPIGAPPSTVAASRTPARETGGAGEGQTAPIQLAYAALEEGASAFRSGSVEVASKRWTEASRIAAEAGNDSLEGDALRGVAQTEQLRGEYAASIEPLEAALELAQRSNDHQREAAALGSLGNAYLAVRQPDRARQYLDEALAIARDARDPSLVATLLNNRGNQQVATGAYREALAVYLESAAVAVEADEGLLTAQARGNAARAALALGEGERAAELLSSAGFAVSSVSSARDAITLRIHLAGSYRELAQLSDAHWEEGLMRAYQSLTRAGERAASISDLRSLSYVRGNLAALYELEGRHRPALELTREALEIAERAEAADLMARWLAQTGTLLRDKGEIPAAIEFFRRAVDLIEQMQPEIRARYGDLDERFRREVEPVYLAFVDTLLQDTDDSESAASQLRLDEARSAVERWKAAELRDYFRDECVTELEASAVRAETLSQTAAIIYPILLPDRLELLISGRWGIERHTVDVTSSEVEAAARTFRRLLEDRSARRFLRPAGRLYEWLVAPYASELERRGIDTLVFVPGGVLRTIPMAALYDGEDFLMERFAVAVTPSLRLLASQPIEPADSKLLLAGLSEAVQGFPRLDSVPTELREIHDLYGGELLLDSDFELGRLETALRETRPGVVHLASHATFTGNPDTSFVLTHDTKLTMNRLSELVGEGRFQKEPLELLFLSACATASGDDRAALGLSGVAIRAGARSAVGSLWNVSDQASSALVIRFYRELGKPGVSKAQALQRAQQDLLARPGFEHPFYWAPFLVMNNWL